HVGQRRAILERARPAFERPAGDGLRVQNLRRACIAETVWLEPRARLVRLVGEPSLPHPVEPEAPFRVARAVPSVDLPVWELALERVRLDQALRPGLLALLLVLDVGDPAGADRSRDGP